MMGQADAMPCNASAHMPWNVTKAAGWASSLYNERLELFSYFCLSFAPAEAPNWLTSRPATDAWRAEIERKTEATISLTRKPHKLLDVGHRQFRLPQVSLSLISAVGTS